jgi:hypothetical protein
VGYGIVYWEYYVVSGCKDTLKGSESIHPQVEGPDIQLILVEVG